MLAWGPNEVAWEKLCYGLEGIMHYGHPNMIKNPRSNTILATEKLRRAGHTGSFSQRKFLETFRPLQALSPLDKVYGAVNFPDPSERQPHIAVDYSRSTYDLALQRRLPCF